MKRIPAILAIVFASTAPALHAQDAATQKAGRLPVPAAAPASVPAAAPSQVTPAPAPAAAEPTETSLIPEQVPQNAKPEAKPDKKSKTAQNEEDLLQRIHFREARTKALRDPKIQAEWDRSIKAKTEFERRDALKSYYKLLYERILKIDATVKSVVDLRQSASLRRLEQTRIDPTEPLDPLDREDRLERSGN